MDDYTPIGRSKIAVQARRSLKEIRCPRDGVVMRVTGTTFVSDATDEMTVRTVPGLPRERRCKVLSVDVRCPACRRTAVMVSLADEGVTPAPLQLVDTAPAVGVRTEA